MLDGERRALGSGLMAAILLLLGWQVHWGQGVPGRGAAPMPRPKPSGRVFPCTFTDVSASAGLAAPQICGRDSRW